MILKVELMNEPVKVRRPTIFTEKEDILTKVEKNTIIFPVVNVKTYETIGYYLLGEIHLAADTLVNTEKGAVGEPIQKKLAKCFISNEEYDFSHTKHHSINKKEFRRIERETFHYFKEIDNTFDNEYIKQKIRGKKFSHKVDEVDFYFHAFSPEILRVIKYNQTLIVLSRDDKEIIICDKKQKNFVHIGKEHGILIQNGDGQNVNINTDEGVSINGKNLKDILSNAFKSVRDSFKQN